MSFNIGERLVDIGLANIQNVYLTVEEKSEYSFDDSKYSRSSKSSETQNGWKRNISEEN